MPVSVMLAVDRGDHGGRLRKPRADASPETCSTRPRALLVSDIHTFRSGGA